MKFAIVPVTMFFTERLLKVLIIDLGIEKEKGKKRKMKCGGMVGAQVSFWVT